MASHLRAGLTSQLTSNSSLQPANKGQGKPTQSAQSIPCSAARAPRTPIPARRLALRALLKTATATNSTCPTRLNRRYPAVGDEALRRLTLQDSDATTLSAASFSALQKSASRQSSRSSSSGRRSTFGLKESIFRSHANACHHPSYEVAGAKGVARRVKARARPRRRLPSQSTRTFSPAAA